MVQSRGLFVTDEATGYQTLKSVVVRKLIHVISYYQPNFNDISSGTRFYILTVAGTSVGKHERCHNFGRCLQLADRVELGLRG